MELSDTVLQSLFGFAAALIGGIAGGYFTLYATNKAIREENAKEIRRGEHEVLNMMAALRVEISTLWSFHMQRIGKRVESLKEGEALEFYYPLTQDYFTVYDSNAALLGRVQDDELRRAIVMCYNKCKKVVDGYKYNNELFHDWRDLKDMPEAEGALKPRVEAKFRALQEYAKVIRSDHFEAKTYVDGLLRLLDETARWTR